MYLIVVLPNNDEQQSNRALKIQQSKSTQCNIETADNKAQVQEGNIKFNESVYASIFGTIEQGNIDTGTQCDLEVKSQGISYNYYYCSFKTCIYRCAI